MATAVFWPTEQTNQSRLIVILFNFCIFRCVLASLYPGLSVRRSVGRSVRPLVTLSSKTREINIFDQMVKKNHVITSSYNNPIKRTHRWPLGPCWYSYISIHSLVFRSLTHLIIDIHTILLRPKSIRRGDGRIN